MLPVTQATVDDWINATKAYVGVECPVESGWFSKPISTPIFDQRTMRGDVAEFVERLQQLLEALKGVAKQAGSMPQAQELESGGVSRGPTMQR